MTVGTPEEGALLPYEEGVARLWGSAASAGGVR
jgi:hypothetical protein